MLLALPRGMANQTLIQLSSAYRARVAALATTAIDPGKTLTHFVRRTTRRGPDADAGRALCEAYENASGAERISARRALAEYRVACARAALAGDVTRVDLDSVTWDAAE